MDKLKAMAIFVEIAEQGSMSAAARNLGEKFVAPIVATFAAAYPNVALELVLSDEFKNMVDEGQRRQTYR